MSVTNFHSNIATQSIAHLEAVDIKDLGDSLENCLRFDNAHTNAMLDHIAPGIRDKHQCLLVTFGYWENREVFRIVIDKEFFDALIEDLENGERSLKDRSKQLQSNLKLIGDPMILLGGIGSLCVMIALLIIFLTGQPFSPALYYSLAACVGTGFVGLGIHDSETESFFHKKQDIIKRDLLRECNRKPKFHALNEEQWKYIDSYFSNWEKQVSSQLQDEGRIPSALTSLIRSYVV